MHKSDSIWTHHLMFFSTCIYQENIPKNIFTLAERKACCLITQHMSGRERLIKAFTLSCGKHVAFSLLSTFYSNDSNSLCIFLPGISMPHAPFTTSAYLSDHVIISAGTLVIKLHYLCCIVFHHQFLQCYTWDTFPWLSQQKMEVGNGISFK